MNLKKIVTRLAAIVLVVASVISSSINAEAATKAEQMLFFKTHYETVKRLAEEYEIPWDFALAVGAYESDYGTSQFARTYYNLTGYACYPDEADGPVVCHEKGQFSSYEEHWEAYFKLLENYGVARWYVTVPKQLAYDIGEKYSGGEIGYTDSICAMIDIVDSLEDDVLMMLEAEAEAQAEAEAELRAEAMRKLGETAIVIIDNDVEANGLIAGATAVTAVAFKEITVNEAANEILSGNFGDYDERRVILGKNYDSVQEYIEYITLPL